MKGKHVIGYVVDKNGDTRLKVRMIVEDGSDEITKVNRPICNKTGGRCLYLMG